MSIVINDFEVVVEQPPEPNPTAERADARSELLPPLRPEEVVRIQIWHESRLRRLWAD